MSSDQGAITVEAVREQLQLLGHSDVPDSVISSFLKDLQTEVEGEAAVARATYQPFTGMDTPNERMSYEDLSSSARGETNSYMPHAPSQPPVVGSDSRGFRFNEGDACQEVEVMPRVGAGYYGNSGRISEDNAQHTAMPLNLTRSPHSQDTGGHIKIPVAVGRYSKMDDIFPSRSHQNASSSHAEEDVSDDEMAFLAQTYAEHGFEYGERKKTSRRSVTSDAFKASRATQPTESTRLKSKRPDSAPTRISANKARGTWGSPLAKSPTKSMHVNAEDRPLTARSTVSSIRASSARAPLSERTNKSTFSPTKSVARSVISCADSVSASRVGSIIVDAKKPVKIDRVARYKKMQESWNKDSFLKATKKPRTIPNFHLMFAQQHANHAREVLEAKKRQPKKPSSYVAPQEKRRDSLRWEVRVNMQKETA